MKRFYKKNCIDINNIKQLPKKTSNLIINYQESKYENAFKDGQELELTAIVISNKQEKEYYNRYKVEYEGKYLYINVDKKVELEYGDKVQVDGEFQEV